ncbi:MAG: TMEM165/GDT1 family protein [Candidatus Methanoperedens sp.]|nr:TMEM165/GDT1 family protein [Candidatus Methanoperedens sp.]MCZ7394792.1 TMEM165/GDT1 family protein [Candidatus Methanoperedens sp.]
MDITPLLTTFGLIALAEFGDKTQLTVIALSAGYDRVKVFTGVVLAFALVTGLGVMVGEGLLRIVPETLIKIIAGIMFVAFGIWMLLSKTNCENNNTSPLGNPLLSTFSMIALAEMGDKTQLSAITLSAKYNSPYLVFLGAVLALASISLLGILLGKKLCEVMPPSKIKLGAGAMFIIFGILFLAGL